MDYIQPASCSDQVSSTLTGLLSGNRGLPYEESLLAQVIDIEFYCAKRVVISVTRNSKWSANGLGRTKVRINHHRWLDEGKYLFIFLFCDNNYGFRNSVKCGLVLNGKTRLQYTQILTIFETTCTI